MRALLLLTVVLPAALGASLPPDDKPFTCTEENKEVAAKVAEDFINNHHHRGYKFRLQKILSAKVEQKGTPECHLDLELSLGETKCHIIDPKSLDKCEIRELLDVQVNAKCTVTVKESEGKAIVEKFTCSTHAALAELFMSICPDCPTLIPLHDPEGVQSVKQALDKFNEEGKHGSYFRLMEIGRMSSQWTFMGKSILANFAIVETDCASDVRTGSQDACLTLCDDTARHGLCESVLLGNGDVDVLCQIFGAQNDSIFHHHPPPVKANCTRPASPLPPLRDPLQLFHELPQLIPAKNPPGQGRAPVPIGLSVAQSPSRPQKQSRPRQRPRPGVFSPMGVLRNKKISPEAPRTVYLTPSPCTFSRHFPN